jgi:putative tryptophan/tyrosine transport system substrate-binding protein
VFELRRRGLLALLSGTAAGISQAFPAEKKESPTIGFLSSRARDASSDLTAAFIRGLEADGFVVGRELRIEYRWARIQIRTATVAGSRPVRSQVSLIAAVGGAHSGLALKAVTSVVPIVFVSAGDPIAFGLVSSPNRPNGNVTGISMITVALAPKRLQLLHELVPAAAGMAMLANSSSPYFEREKIDVMASARALGRKLHVFTASNALEIETAFSSLRDEIGTLLISGDLSFDGERDHLVALAARYSIPTVYQWSEFATIGGLMSYGTSILDAYQQAGTYVAKILNGVKTADLPVLQPTRLELVINLKTAAALGLTVPASLLASADEIIE